MQRNKRIKMKKLQVTENMSMIVFSSEEKAKINKRLKGLNEKIRRNAAIAAKKAQEIYITR